MSIFNGQTRGSHYGNGYQQPPSDDESDNDLWSDADMDDVVVDPPPPPPDNSRFFLFNKTILMHNDGGLAMHYVDVCDDPPVFPTSSYWKRISGQRRRLRKASRHRRCLRKSCYRCRRPCPKSHKEETVDPECIQILTDMLAGLNRVWRLQNEHSYVQGTSADNTAKL